MNRAQLLSILGLYVLLCLAGIGLAACADPRSMPAAGPAYRHTGYSHAASARH